MILIYFITRKKAQEKKVEHEMQRYVKKKFSFYYTFGNKACSFYLNTNNYTVISSFFYMIVIVIIQGRE